MQLQMFLSKLQLTPTTMKLFHLIQFAMNNKYLYYKLLAYQVPLYMQLLLLDFAQPTGNIGQMLHQLEPKLTHNYVALLIQCLYSITLSLCSEHLLPLSQSSIMANCLLILKCRLLSKNEHRNLSKQGKQLSPVFHSNSPFHCLCLPDLTSYIRFVMLLKQQIFCLYYYMCSVIFPVCISHGKVALFNVIYTV